jgi:hypothetical protein
MSHDPKLIAAIRDEMEAGIKAPDIIAIRLDVDIDVVAEIIDEFSSVAQESRSNVEIMRANLSLLQQLLETAEWQYRGDPDVDNASAITSMIQTSLQTIKEIESRKDPVVVMNEILGRAVQPLFRDFIKYATTEAAQVRADLFEGVPREFHGRIDEALKDLVKGIGRASSADYKKTVQMLASVLECKAEDEKVRPLLKAIPGGRDEQEAAEKGAPSS